MSSRRQPFSAPEALRTAVANIGLAREAERIFLELPALRNVALQYCRYVSPLVPLEDGQCLLEATLRDAIAGYSEAAVRDPERAMRTFIQALARSVGELCRVRLSVQTRDGSWLIWTYDEPLIEWMPRHGRKALQIRRRDKPVAKGPVLVKMLGYICSVRDLQVAHLDLATLS